MLAIDFPPNLFLSLEQTMGWTDDDAPRAAMADADVLRWYFDERSSPAGTPAEAASTDFGSLDECFGSEAAQPALQLHLMRELQALGPLR